MAKKKSKGFIIPAIHFLTTTPKQKSQKDKQTDPTGVSFPQKNIAQGAKPVKLKVSVPEQETPANKSKVDKPLPNLEPKARRKSALSLSSLKRNKELEEEKKKALASMEEKTNLPKDPFDQERFDKIWKAYIEGLHGKGEKILASILKADHPVIKEQMIHVTYPNQLMKTELLKVKPRVLKDLREKLNNYSVDFEIAVKEENVKRFAYTPQEKYELLREKNKDLSLLRKTFNLEL